MVNQEGRSHKSLDYIGQVVVFEFYLHTLQRCMSDTLCTNVAFKMIFKSLQRDQLQLVSLTVDPYYDTPEVLKSYAEHFSTNAEYWHFSNRRKKDLPVIIRGFQQAFMR